MKIPQATTKTLPSEISIFVKRKGKKKKMSTRLTADLLAAKHNSTETVDGELQRVKRQQLSTKDCFPNGSEGKESSLQSRRPRRLGFDPWVEKIPLEEERVTPLQILA